MSIAERTRLTRQASMGWHIQRLAGRLDAAMTRALKPHGLNLQQFPILMTSLETPGLTQSDYSARFRMPAYAVSRAIDSLVECGLVERTPDPNSRRSINIHPTQAALALAPALFEVIESVNAEMTASLDHDDRQALQRILVALVRDWQ